MKKFAAKPSPAVAWQRQEAELGPLATAVKRKSSRQQWRSIVKLAHKKGYTVDSFFDVGTPRPLKQRTHSSLRAQASKTMNAVYKPEELRLSQRQQSINAIDAKRERDERYYADWLTQRQSQMQVHGDAADQALRTQAQAVHDSTAKAFTDLRSGLQEGARQSPGNVSDPAQAKAFDLTPEQTRALGTIDAQRLGIEGDIAGQKQYRADSAANSAAYSASIAAKRQGETWKALSEVADDKQKLTLDKAAKSADEVARLIDRETEKANANRDYQAVAGKLGIQADQLQQEQRQFLATLGIKKGELAVKGMTAQEKARHNRQMEQQAAASSQIAQGHLDVAWYKARHPNKGKGNGSKPGDSPQSRFEFGYAKLASSKRENGKAFTAGYVGQKRETMIAAVQASTKVSRELANRIVTAYISRAGDDPGSYRDWGRGQSRPH